MTTIQEVVEKLIASGLTQTEIGNQLGISHSMVSRYRTGYLASLDVAKRWYIQSGEVLHPFAKESIIKEIKDSNE